MKFYGKIGYGETVETVSGVWEEQVTEREYFGDFMRNSGSLQSSDKVNDNFNISHSISIVADPYALDKFCFIAYKIDVIFVESNNFICGCSIDSSIFISVIYL